MSLTKGAIAMDTVLALQELTPSFDPHDGPAGDPGLPSTISCDDLSMKDCTIPDFEGAYHVI
jgi:hypothetical protein